MQQCFGCLYHDLFLMCKVYFVLPVTSVCIVHALFRVGHFCGCSLIFFI